MTTDRQRNFSVRFLDSALRRVESTAKPYYGGRLSTGEAIRRLAEERLDEIEAARPRGSAPQGLLPILSAWRSGENLSLDQLRFLASAVNTAYRQCRRDHVSHDLLVANVSAFRDAVRLHTRGKTRALDTEGEYFLGNLSTAKQIRAKTLGESVDRWITQLEEHPSQVQAEFASRNLSTYLRDETLSDGHRLARAMKPYLPALLQVAIRGYWDRERQPLIERPKAPLESGTPPRLLSAISEGPATVRPVAQEHGLSAVFELAERECWISASTFVDLEDFREVTLLARGGADARGATYGWNVHGDRAKSYELVTSLVRMLLKPVEFEAIARCVEALFRESTIASLIERLRYVYGRI